MAYGTLKCDNITFTNGGVDQTVTVSGIVQSISGDITATGTIQGAAIIGTSTVSGATVTGDVGVFTAITGGTAGFTTVTGATVTGTTANFVTVSGTTVTGTTANFGGVITAPTIRGTTTVSGATVTGAAGQFTTITGVSAGFTTVTGTTVTGTTANFATLSGTTITGGHVTTASGTYTGNVTAAAFVPTGSSVPTNGIYLPSANNVALSTNGTGRLFVDASGRISVANQFTDSSLASNIGGLNVLTAGSSDNNALTFAWNHQNLTTEIEQRIEWLFGDDASANNYKSAGFIGMGKEGKWQSDSVRDSYLAFATTDAAVASEKVRITSAGLVGIGTSAPGKLLEISQSSSTAYDSANTNGLSHEVRIANTNVTTGTAASLQFVNGGTGISSINSVLTGSQAAALTFAVRGGSSATPERMRIDSSGRVGIGTASPQDQLHLTGSLYAEQRVYAGDGTAATPSIRFWNSNVGLYAPGSNALGFSTGSSERARIDSSGRLLVGTSTYSGSGTGFEIEGTGSFGPQIRATAKGNDSYPVYHITRKARGNSTVQSGDELYNLGISGFDGTNYITAASINALVDGTPGANDMPGRLVFSTTADGASSPTERMRINNAGLVGIGSDNPQARLTVYASSSGEYMRVGTTDSTGGRSLSFSSYTAGGTSGVGHEINARNALGEIRFSTGSTERLSITSAGVLKVADAGNIEVGTTTGTKIGTATTQKLGFYNATPVVQPAAVADATDAATVITQLNDLLAKLRTLGLIAT